MEALASRSLTHGLARSLGAARAWVLPATAQALVEGLRDAAPTLDWWPTDEGAVVGVAPLGGCPLACRDLKALGVQARAAGEILVADVSLMGPAGCAAVRLGAHIAMAAHEDGWCVVGVDRTLLQAAPAVPVWFDTLAEGPLPAGADVAAALDAWAHRWHVVSDAAQVVAAYLRCHPLVASLRYPGLKSDPSFAVAARTLVGGFGPLIDYQLVGSVAWHRLVCTGADPRAQVMRLEQALARGAGGAGGDGGDDGDARHPFAG